MLGQPKKFPRGRIFNQWYCLKLSLMVKTKKQMNLYFLITFNVSFISRVCSQSPILVQFSHSVVPDSLQPLGLQHARLPCPSPTPGACSNSCPLSQWLSHQSNHLTFCRHLVLLPSIFPSIRVFSSESVLSIRWPVLELQLQHQFFWWLFRVDFL